MWKREKSTFLACWLSHKSIVGNLHTVGLRWFFSSLSHHTHPHTHHHILIFTSRVQFLTGQNAKRFRVHFQGSQSAKKFRVKALKVRKIASSIFSRILAGFELRQNFQFNFHRGLVRIKERKIRVLSARELVGSQSAKIFRVPALLVCVRKIYSSIPSGELVGKVRKIRVQFSQGNWYEIKVRRNFEFKPSKSKKFEFNFPMEL